MDFDKLKNLIEVYPSKITDLRKDIKEFMIQAQTPYPLHWSLFQKCYHELFLSKSTDERMCPVCQSKILPFLGLRIGYGKNCSASCRNKNSDFILKYKVACQKKYGTDFASQSTTFKEDVKETCIKKFGVDNPFKSDTIKNKYKKKMTEKYGVDNPSKSVEFLGKIRQSRIDSGDWISDNDRTDLEVYRNKVKSITAKSYHDHFYKINPDNVLRSRYEYHLDHIFSIDEGFKRSIPPEIIGHWTNLRMLWYSYNCIKNIKCDTTEEQLYEMYYSTT